MNHQIKLTGNLKTYLRWPVMLSLLWAVATIHIYVVDRKAGYCVAGYTLAYFVVAMMLRLSGRKKLQQDLIRFAQSYGRLQMKMMKEMAVMPSCLMDMTSRAWFTSTGDGDQKAEMVTST